jgi:hypothetical protein
MNNTTLKVKIQGKWRIKKLATFFMLEKLSVQIYAMLSAPMVSMYPTNTLHGWLHTTVVQFVCHTCSFY